MKQTGPISALKLQKLVYYTLPWHLVWSEEEMFKERVEAWVGGPVFPDLYAKHRGQFLVNPGDSDIGGNPENLTADQLDSIDHVLSTYGKKSPQYLSDLTHSEMPWREARVGLSPLDRGAREITRASMAEYYESILPA